MPDINIGRLRGGFCVYWDDADTGKRRRYQLKAQSRAEAESEARDVYLSKNRPVGDVTVADVWDAYLTHIAGKPTAKTMSYTAKAVLPHFGALKPRQISIEDCREYQKKRLIAGRKIGSVHTELGHLRSAMNWGAKVHMIDRAPFIELPPKPDSEVNPLTDLQIAALLDGCYAPHVRLAVVLLLCTGARVGAILDLTWDRIDFENGVIDLRLPDGVTRKGRAVVPMNRMARAALETAKHAALTDYVVEWAGDRVGNIRKGYTSALRRAGLEQINIHQIRHTVAVKMLAAGKPLEMVSQYLGHSNTKITYKTYARFMPSHLEDAAEILNFETIRFKRS